MTILIVDDDASQRILLRHVLEKYQPVEVIEAKNGIEALRVIDGTIPDLVILDLMMPILNGYNTLKAIRKKDATKRIPVIISSGMQDAETIKNVADLGVLDYLLKPLNAQQINDRLAKFFN